jgi:hypothetical protein
LLKEKILNGNVSSIPSIRKYQVVPKNSKNIRRIWLKKNALLMFVNISISFPNSSENEMTVLGCEDSL